MTSTPGLKFLEKAGVAVTLHPYAYNPDADAVGLQAAEAAGFSQAVAAALEAAVAKAAAMGQEKG